MKKTKIISLLLSLTLLVGVANPAALAIEARAADGTTSGSGMEISKTAVYNTETNDYTITLEAYATGSKVISTEKKDIPTDIVLVLDQSGSMDHCIVCGEEMDGYDDYHTQYTYTKATSVYASSWITYYVKVGSTYTAVSYCNGTHKDWYGYVSTNCSGGAGWYTSKNSTDHTAENKYIPNTQDPTNGVQFYTRGESQEACTSRLSALKNAVTTFVNSVNEKAKGADGKYGTRDDINHRIAMVGFATGSYTANPSAYPAYGNTELFIGSTEYNYHTTASSHYNSAFQDMNTTTGYNNVIASKEALAARGATCVDLGINMANGIFNAYENDYQYDEATKSWNRNRVMIVFTDGEPAQYSGYSSDVADKAITKANTTKKTHKATVYTVGIFAGADATSAGNQNGTIAEKSNWFMQNVSSNNGVVQNPSYYLSAGDSASLNSIFQQISNNIESGGSSTTLSAETVIKDIVASQFELPAGAKDDDITLETYQCTGKSGDSYTWRKNSDAMGANATVNETDGTVSVSGFDFAANYVGTVTNNNNVSYRGHKLVIKFNVKAKDGFLGGNDVYTNASAGVYENNSATEPVLTFNRPQVNVQIKDVTITATDKNVYLLGDLTAEQIKSGATVKCGNVSLNLTKDNYGLESWQTEYVDITVEIKDKDGNTVTDLNDLSEDTTYSVSAKVSPKTTNPTSDQGTKAVEKTGNASAAINVFNPELTYKDSSVYYGDTAPTDYSSNLTSTKWKHRTTEDSSVTMTGENPTLYMIYTPETHKIQDGKINTKEDVAVDVAVKIGTTDVTDKTTFVHTKCDANCTDPANGKFWLHVKTCQLTVTKTGGAGNESYVFTVYKDGVKYSEVSIYGNNSETIYELPVGSYTIAEESGWSWRWTANNGSAAILSKDVTSGTITCTNSSNGKNYWLNGFSEIIKNIIEKK